MVANRRLDSSLTRSSSQAAAKVKRSARLLCGSSPIADSLRSVGLRGGDGNGAGGTQLTALLLQRHGFHTALDMRLLESGGDEAAELIEQMRLGGTSIADRAKVRLLIGDHRRDHRLPDSASDAGAAGAPTALFGTRRMQNGPHSEAGLSSDTIAIVLSVLVGAAGYVVQVCMWMTRGQDLHFAAG
eukprot:SAG31_NODE_1306_length_8889_cov_17.337315_11_plen_186_part_00